MIVAVCFSPAESLYQSGFFAEMWDAETCYHPSTARRNKWTWRTSINEILKNVFNTDEKYKLKIQQCKVLCYVLPLASNEEPEYLRVKYFKSR